MRKSIAEYKERIIELMGVIARLKIIALEEPSSTLEQRIEKYQKRLQKIQAKISANNDIIAIILNAEFSEQEKITHLNSYKTSVLFRARAEWGDASALALAIILENQAVAIYLIQRGVEVNAGYCAAKVVVPFPNNVVTNSNESADYDSPIFLAAAKGQYRVVRALLASGANFDWQVLENAIRARSYRIVDLLLVKGQFCVEDLEHCLTIARSQLMNDTLNKFSASSELPRVICRLRFSLQQMISACRSPLIFSSPAISGVLTTTKPARSVEERAERAKRKVRFVAYPN